MQIKNEENGTFIQDNLENELDRVNVETGNSEDESEKSQVDYLDINEEN
jgi:ArsR family metal-binding transcriptional regulator